MTWHVTNTHFSPNGQYINGDWNENAESETISVQNPTTEETLAELPRATEAEIEGAIDAARSASRDWQKTPAQERGEVVREISELVVEYEDQIADLLVAEQGKPIADARAEIKGAADVAEYMAEWDRRIEGDILPGENPNESVHLQRKPMGVVVAISPWNYPVESFAQKLAPALVAGNTVIAKPSEVTPLSTLRLAELIDKHIELPDGVFNLVTGGAQTGASLTGSSNIDMISMTGSVGAGKAIMRDAADNMTKLSLELGGKAPAIVCKDADLDDAVEDVLTARITNAGQVCTCAERVYVHSDVRDEFEKKYIDATEQVEFGNPHQNPDMGPQVSAAELEKTEAAVSRARKNGAEVLVGGQQPNGESYRDGYWYEPTVITGVKQEMEIIQQEVFGPVTPIVEIDSLDEAIAKANDSQYGLSSYIYTDSYQTAMRASEELQFGETYINRSLGESWHGHHIGWNESGISGEGGKYGFLQYTQLKTVYHDYS